MGRIRRVRDATAKFLGKKTGAEIRLERALKAANKVFQLTGSASALKKASKLAAKLAKYGGTGLSVGLILATDLAKPAGASPAEEAAQLREQRSKEKAKLDSKAKRMLK